MKPLTLVFVTVVFAAAAVCQADPPRPIKNTAPAKAPFVFEAGEVELRTLIERCGAYLQRNILVNDLELSTARQGGAMSATWYDRHQGLLDPDMTVEFCGS